MMEENRKKKEEQMKKIQESKQRKSNLDNIVRQAGLVPIKFYAAFHALEKSLDDDCAICLSGLAEKEDFKLESEETK